MGTSVAMWMRAALEELGCTQKELAERAGIPRQSVSELLNGKKKLVPRTAVKMGLALGLDPFELVREQADAELLRYLGENPGLWARLELRRLHMGNGDG